MKIDVAITPAGVHSLVSKGHQVLIEKSAGVGSGIEAHRLYIGWCKNT